MIDQCVGVESLRIAEPSNYDLASKAVGYELGSWSYINLPPGTRKTAYPHDITLYVLKGEAMLLCAGEGRPVKPGDLVKVPGGLKAVWEVVSPLEFRYAAARSLSLQEEFRRFVQSLDVEGGDVSTGSFEPCTEVAVHLEPLRVNSLLVTHAQTGRLKKALFPIPIKALRLCSLNLDYLRRYPLHGLEPVRDPQSMFVQVEALLGVNKASPLRYAEEFFIVQKGQAFRWHPDDRGRSFAGQVATLSGADRILDKAIHADGRLEAIVEVVLSSLWGPDTPRFMIQFMSHPTENPYPVPNLYVPGIRSVSERLESRWCIEAICPAEESVVTPELAVRFRGLTPRKVKARRCSFEVEWLAPFWSSNGQYATWSYTLEWVNGEVQVSKRKLTQQYD